MAKQVRIRDTVIVTPITYCREERRNPYYREDYRRNRAALAVLGDGQALAAVALQEAKKQEQKEQQQKHYFNSCSCASSLHASQDVTKFVPEHNMRKCDVCYKTLCHLCFEKHYVIKHVKQ
jgi:hypothetical protein